MAYDKVVDSAVLNAGLKQIADAIREKGGTSGNLAFPAAMAEAIVEISGGDDTYRIAKGTFTPSESVTSYPLFSVDDLVSMTGRRVQYFLLIDGFSNGITGALGAYAYASAAGYIDLIGSTTCTASTPAYYMSRNNAGSLYDTVAATPITASKSTGITLSAKSSNPIYPMEYRWIMVMRDD